MFPQVTYISVEFCASGRPDHSLALYKSVNHGITWTALQFYSDQCPRVFGRPFTQRANRSNEQQALCASLSHVDTADYASSINPPHGSSNHSNGVAG